MNLLANTLVLPPLGVMSASLVNKPLIHESKHASDI